MSALRAASDVAAAAVAALMVLRASARVKPIWITAAIGATVLVSAFTFAVKARLTGSHVEPDLVLVAMTAGITLASKGRWELLFSNHQWQRPVARPDYPVERARNLAGAAFIALYIGLELFFDGTLLGLRVS